MFEAHIAFYIPVAMLLMATPGPANTLVMSRSATSLGAALAVVAGLLVSIVVLLSAAILGLASLVLASQPAFLALKWIGAAYLFYLGVHLIQQAGRTEAASPSVRGSAVSGFLTGVTNPKALIFYFAFLPQFLSDKSPVQLQMIGLGLVDLALAAIVFGLYALAGFKLTRALRALNARGWLDRVVGAVMITSAVAVLRTARSAR
jgi:homoserine/homoserine lactone efflux protein